MARLNLGASGTPTTPSSGMTIFSDSADSDNPKVIRSDGVVVDIFNAVSSINGVNLSGAIDLFADVMFRQFEQNLTANQSISSTADVDIVSFIYNVPIAGTYQINTSALVGYDNNARSGLIDIEIDGVTTVICSAEHKDTTNAIPYTRPVFTTFSTTGNKTITLKGRCENAADTLLVSGYSVSVERWV